MKIKSSQALEMGSNKVIEISSFNALILNIIAQLTITSMKLFVLVINMEFDRLKSVNTIHDISRHLSMKVYSVEWVNISNNRLPGIALEYNSEAELSMLHTAFNEIAIAE